jgi:hypothetical protein
MSTTPDDVYQRFLPWRRSVEIGAWVLFTLINATINAITTTMDIERAGLDFAPWKPWVWEFSSNLTLLALVPLVMFVSRRWPLTWGLWRRHLPMHLAGTVAYSVLHVLFMVGLRKLAYLSAGERYDFGNWWYEFGYEFLKDARSYLFALVFIEAWRLLMRRLQGEASLLARGEEDDPTFAQPGPEERPERFLVRKLGREFLVAANDIEWMQASANYVNLHVRGRDYPLRITLAALESRVDPSRFRRIHRSYMVNLDQVASIEPLESGDARVHLRDGTTLPVSRRYRGGLRAGNLAAG